MIGTVFLVGTGPGDPHLLTVRAADLLSRAGAVLAPADLPPGFEEFCPEDVDLEPISDGTDVAARLMELARSHRIVARLYRGNPYDMQTGRSEAARLATAGVPYESVAAVSSTAAASACGGVGPDSNAESAPDRSVAVTLEEVDPGAQWPENWHEGADAYVTIDASRPAAGGVTLLRSGLAPPDAPAVFIANPGTPRQQTISGTVRTIVEAEVAREKGVLMLGQKIRPSHWSYENRPLHALRIALTRPRGQSARLAAMLRRAGAEVLIAPTIRIVPPADLARLRDSAARARDFDLVIFSSANAVDAFWSALVEVGQDSRSLAGATVCAIGPATAEALASRGVIADLIPSSFVAEALLSALEARGGLKGAKVLFPRAEAAREVLANGLRERGAEVADIDAYRTVPDLRASEPLKHALSRGEIDIVTFTSGSTAQSFADIVGRDPPAVEIATIGPITSSIVLGLGWEVAVEASVHTAEGLYDAILDRYRADARRARS